jgi:O-antigen ligase
VIQLILIAHTAAGLVAESPMLGTGYGSFEEAAVQGGAIQLLAAELQTSKVPQNYYANAGNQVLQTLVDGGLVGLGGLLIMFAALGRVLRSGARLAEPAGSLFGAGLLWLVAMLVGNQTAVWILPGSLLTCLLIVLSGFAASIVTSQSESAAATSVLRLPQ